MVLVQNGVVNDKALNRRTPLNDGNVLIFRLRIIQYLFNDVSFDVVKRKTKKQKIKAKYCTYLMLPERSR